MRLPLAWGMRLSRASFRGCSRGSHDRVARSSGVGGPGEFAGIDSSMNNQDADGGGARGNSALANRAKKKIRFTLMPPGSDWSRCELGLPPCARGGMHLAVTVCNNRRRGPMAEFGATSADDR